jgi:hypothetical protein
MTTGLRIRALQATPERVIAQYDDVRDLVIGGGELSFVAPLDDSRDAPLVTFQLPLGDDVEYEVDVA